MCSVKKCFTFVEAILWSVSTQISIAHLCQPNAASSNYTASWDDTGRPWAAHSMTLYWRSKASLLLCTFLWSSNMACIPIYGGRIFHECPVSEDFCNYIYMRHTLSAALWPMWVTTVAITQQPEKYYKHLQSHLYRYWHFEETLLTLSQVVDTSTIYLHRYICCRCIRGYHVYKQVWSVSEGDSLY